MSSGPHGLPIPTGSTRGAAVQGFFPGDTTRGLNLGRTQGMITFDRPNRSCCSSEILETMVPGVIVSVPKLFCDKKTLHDDNF